MGKSKVVKPKGTNRSKGAKLPPQPKASINWKCAPKSTKSIPKKKSEDLINLIDRNKKLKLIRSSSSATWGVNNIALAPSALAKFNKTVHSSTFVAKFDEKHLASISEEEPTVSVAEIPGKKEIPKVVISNRFSGLGCDSDSDDDVASNIPLQPSALAGMLV